MRTFAIDRVNRQFLLEHPAQAADVIDGFGKSAAVELLAENDPDTLARIWRYLSPARIDEIVPEMPEKLLKQALHSVDPTALAMSLLRISDTSRDRCLELLPRRVKAEVRRLMDYPPGSAGRVMDSRVPSFRGRSAGRRHARSASPEQAERSAPALHRRLRAAPARYGRPAGSADRRADRSAEGNRAAADRRRLAIRRS